MSENNQLRAVGANELPSIAVISLPLGLQSRRVADRVLEPGVSVSRHVVPVAEAAAKKSIMPATYLGDRCLQWVERGRLGGKGTLRLEADFVRLFHEFAGLLVKSGLGPPRYFRQHILNGPFWQIPT